MVLTSDNFKKLLHLGQLEQLLDLRGGVKETKGHILALRGCAVERKKGPEPAAVHESGLGQVDLDHRRRPAQGRLHLVAKRSGVYRGQLYDLRDDQVGPWLVRSLAGRLKVG